MNGEVHRIDEDISLDRYKIHTIEIVVDRLVIRDGIEKRLADSIELAMRRSDGIVVINVLDDEDLVFSERFACVECGISFEELTPRMFSFNSPYGACPECAGLGTKEEFDPEFVLDADRSITEGALVPWRRSFEGTRSDFFANRVITVCKRFGIDPTVPVNQLPPEHQKILLHGAGMERFRFKYHDFAGNLVSRETRYEGLVPYLERRYRDVHSQGARKEVESFITARTCPACGGARLRPESLAVTVGGKSIMEITALSCQDAYDFFEALELTDRELLIAGQVLKEIQERLGFLVNVGLDYLTLNRSAGTLAGGEAQRIRLATQIGSSLVGSSIYLMNPALDYINAITCV